MKNKIKLSIIIMAFALVIASCGGGIKRDAKKVAKITCKAEKMATQVLSGEVTMEESMALANEAAELITEMEGKYDSPKDYEKFLKALEKAKGGCK